MELNYDTRSIFPVIKDYQKLLNIDNEGYIDTLSYTNIVVQCRIK
jgi:hypothetical protein